MCAKRILLLLLFPLVEASHASLQSVLSAERREYVLDEHGRASPVMRREGLVTRRLQNRNLKALMQRRLQERLLSRKQKLLDLQQQMQQVHARSAVFTPKCSVLSKYRLKAAGEETLRDEKTFESCMAACRPRDNLAKGKSATSSAFVAAPSLALDGNAATEFRSILAAKPWWQVDLGEAKQVGDVYVSSAISLEGFVVGLRKSAGCPGAATAAGTGAGESEEEPEEESDDEEAELLEELSSQIGKQNSGCALVTCGIIDANSNFVNCKGEEGRFVVVTSTSTESKTLRITEVEVWEDQVLTRSGGAAAGSIGLASASSPYSNLIDGKTNTPAKSAVGDDLWVHIAVPQDSESIGKISIFPGPDRSVFAPTADKPVLVGFSKSGCSKDGCQKEGTLCGTLKATKNMGPYIVDCGGKEAKFVWLEFPGTGRHIEIGEVEVEKSADCEQVVFTEQGSTKQCLHYAAYSQQSAAPEAGVTYTSAVCHTSGKVGPPGLNGPKGKKGDVGLQGPTGPNGLKGDKGDMGAMGEQGDVGPEGPEGQEADVNGLATMGQLNGAAVLSIVITVAVLVILLQQVGPAKQAPGQKVVEGGEEEAVEEAVEGEEMYAEGEGAGEVYEEGEQPAH